MPGIKPVQRNKRVPNELMDLYEHGNRKQEMKRSKVNYAGRGGPRATKRKEDVPLAFGKYKGNSSSSKREGPVKGMHALRRERGNDEISSIPVKEKRRSNKLSSSLSSRDRHEEVPLEVLRAEIDLMDRVKAMLGETRPLSSSSNNNQNNQNTPRKNSREQIARHNDDYDSRRDISSLNRNYDHNNNNNNNNRLVATPPSNRNNNNDNNRLVATPPSNRNNNRISSPVVRHTKQQTNSVEEDGFFKWGQPGAGAPLRNHQGKVLTSRIPYEEQQKGRWADKSNKYNNMNNNYNSRPSSGPSTSRRKSYENNNNYDLSLPSNFAGLHTETAGTYRKIIAPPGGRSHFTIGGGMSPSKDAPPRDRHHQSPLSSSFSNHDYRQSNDDYRQSNDEDHRRGSDRRTHSSSSSYNKKIEHEHENDYHLHADLNGSFRKIIAPPGGASHFQVGSMVARPDSPSLPLSLDEYRPPSVGINGRGRGGESRERSLSTRIGEKHHDYSPTYKKHSNQHPHGRKSIDDYPNERLEYEFNRVVDYNNHPSSQHHRRTHVDLDNEPEITAKQMRMNEQRRMLEEQIAEKKELQRLEEQKEIEKKEARKAMIRAKRLHREGTPKNYRHPNIVTDYEQHDHYYVHNDDDDDEEERRQHVPLKQRKEQDKYEHKQYNDDDDDDDDDDDQLGEENQEAIELRIQFEQMRQELAEAKAALKTKEKKLSVKKRSDKKDKYKKDESPVLKQGRLKKISKKKEDIIAKRIKDEKQKAMEKKMKMEERAKRIAAKTKKKKVANMSPINNTNVNRNSRKNYIDDIENELMVMEHHHHNDNDNIHSPKGNRSLSSSLKLTPKQHNNNSITNTEKVKRIRSETLSLPLQMSPRSIRQMNDPELYATLVAKEEESDIYYSPEKSFKNNSNNDNMLSPSQQHYDWSYNNDDEIKFTDEGDEQDHKKLLEAMSTIRAHSAKSSININNNNNDNDNDDNISFEEDSFDVSYDRDSMIKQAQSLSLEEETSNSFVRSKSSPLRNNDNNINTSPSKQQPFTIIGRNDNNNMNDDNNDNTNLDVLYPLSFSSSLLLQPLTNREMNNNNNNNNNNKTLIKELPIKALSLEKTTSFNSNYGPLTSPNRNISSRPSTTRHVHFCDECSEMEATEYCKECSSNYCSSCCADMHNNSSHNIVSLVQDDYGFQLEDVQTRPEDYSFEESEEFHIHQAKRAISTPLTSKKKKGPKILHSPFPGM